MGRLNHQARSSLYDFQQTAVKAVESFLDRNTSGGRSFIVSMPTGSGKSGVIAYVAQNRLGDAGDILLLCPWDALAKQLANDVGDRFWKHAGVDGSSMAKPVRLYPSNAQSAIDGADSPTIWVMTLAALVGLNPEIRKALASRLHIVIVDEGHYEPAPSWATAVRSLDKSTVLFTATPFRNDVKYFDVAKGDSHHYPARTAIAEARLRTPKFQSVPIGTPQLFVDQLTAFDDSELSDTDKIIVRCSSHQEIRHIVRLLQERGQLAVGIHERFKAEDKASGLLKGVPASHEARYWVHQNKLIEGVDHHEFRCVALFRVPTSDRALIQQIGRVLRGVKRNANAWVLGAQGDKLQNVWDAYLSYDFQNDASASTVREVLDLAAGRHFYTSGSFRAPLDVDNIDPSELRVPRSFVVYDVPPTSTQPLNELLTALDKALDDRDGEKVGNAILGHWAQPGRPDLSWAAQLLYLSEQSPILARSSFYDSRLALAFFAVTESRLYAQPALRLDLRGAGFQALSSDVLRSAFARSTGTFTSVSLKNTDLSSTAERSRTQTAESLSAVAPDLGDYFKSPSTITGIVNNSAPDGEVYGALRYVGFANSRIREHGRIPVVECLDWLAQVEMAFANHDDSKVDEIFSRYAEVVTCARPVVKNFLLDLPASEVGEYAAPDGSSLRMKDICVDVDSNSNFKLVSASDDTEFECSLTWLGRRYEFQSNQLDARFTRANSTYASLSSEISERQAFRLIVHEQGSDEDLVQYVAAQFVRPRSTLALRSNGKGVVLDNLLAELSPGTVTSEKGDSVKGRTWTDGSMFKKICDEVEAGSLFGEPVAPDSVIICDDDSGETADFYVVDDLNRRLIVVHAKVKSGNGGRGASGLYDVVAQAQKHLGTIRPGGVGFDRTRMRKRWEKNWILDDSDVPRVQSGQTADVAAKTVWNALRNPAYERLIMIATAGILNKSEFLTHARKGTPQSLQALYLMQSVWAAAGSVGARLRIVVDA
ncbi:DEAD/DEAH box helicase [Arthrobacter sp. OY3WO11]|uniref:DEAD/DEAH box helicase n=1 Tax=Arthrobacter sp. OY3WO11 TaxID=1835723 RepID=UPI0007CF079C|nr:DEAD/DEAH box helicase [Arthrobacter sp. OY3WO11]OAE01057.1 hypothetical protein A6A22_06150 [Arthrobacter sp. OY3WO11]